MRVVSVLSIRWVSKVAEMEAMSSPDLRNIFSEKTLIEFFFQSSKVKFPSILGEIPFVKSNGFKWKIEGNFTLEL